MFSIISQIDIEAAKEMTVLAAASSETVRFREMQFTIFLISMGGGAAAWIMYFIVSMMRDTKYNPHDVEQKKGSGGGWALLGVVFGFCVGLYIYDIDIASLFPL